MVKPDKNIEKLLESLVWSDDDDISDSESEFKHIVSTQKNVKLSENEYKTEKYTLPKISNETNEDLIDKLSNCIIKDNTKTLYKTDCLKSENKIGTEINVNFNQTFNQEIIHDVDFCQSSDNDIEEEIDFSQLCENEIPEEIDFSQSCGNDFSDKIKEIEPKNSNCWNYAEIWIFDLLNVDCFELNFSCNCANLLHNYIENVENLITKMRENDEISNMLNNITQDLSFYLNSTSQLNCDRIKIKTESIMELIEKVYITGEYNKMIKLYIFNILAKKFVNITVNALNVSVNFDLAAVFSSLILKYPPMLTFLIANITKFTPYILVIDELKLKNLNFKPIIHNMKKIGIKHNCFVNIIKVTFGLLVTDSYNHTYSPLVKNALMWFNQFVVSLDLNNYTEESINLIFISLSLGVEVAGYTFLLYHQDEFLQSLGKIFQFIKLVKIRDQEKNVPFQQSILSSFGYLHLQRQFNILKDSRIEQDYQFIYNFPQCESLLAGDFWNLEL
ncbi:hypothetical protein A3Q56_03312 [Intoshia linei]|uniref:Uncharacterized protein n=1 Tax=Intoshia linei TaxID=1819745 RepID=A0A177B6B3_9BILA|nr:hypothetical protein A3Q56_03312 [Intoshia linei]